MTDFKLKSVYLRQRKDLIQKRDTEELVILRIGAGEIGIGRANYHRIRVPIHGTVEIHYETTNQTSLLRLIFQLDQRTLTIQFFTWDDAENHYIEAPLDDVTLNSPSFQNLLQSISFLGNNHFSYLTGSSDRLTDLLNL